MKRITAICIALLLLAAAFGCRNAAANTYTTAAGISDAAEQPAGDTPAEEKPEQPAEQPAEGQNTTEEDPTVQNPIATITMKDGGVMKLELYPDVAPNTVKNFISLANSGFYDGLTFHRIIAGFMIQGGDPAGNGSGGPDYCIKGEFASNGFNNPLSHKRGVISMARTPMPDSAGSQFFIMHADGDFLDGQYAAFGMLTEGYTVLDKIAMSKTDSADAPLEPVVIDTIRVETFGVDFGEPEVIR